MKMEKKFNLNKATEAINGLLNNESETSKKIEENTLSLFNDGCDLVLSHLEKTILDLEASDLDTEEKYRQILVRVVGMRAVVDRRTVVKKEEPAVLVRDSQIILPD